MARPKKTESPPEAQEAPETTTTDEPVAGPRRGEFGELLPAKYETPVGTREDF